jgi:phosphohistidine phosphatase SixA
VINRNDWLSRTARLVFRSAFRSLYGGILKGIFVLRLAAALLALLVLTPAQATEAGWALLSEGGHVVLIRHAQAAGNGDTGNLDIAKCATQRNLSDRGKLQARKMGALFAARAAPVDRVLSSRYCRCIDTARFAFGEDIVEPTPALDPLAKDEPARQAQLAEMRALVANFSGSGNLVLVTHQENIVALTGISPREGEAIIVKAEGDKLHVIGRNIFD